MSALANTAIENSRHAVLRPRRLCVACLFLLAGCLVGSARLLAQNPCDSTLKRSAAPSPYAYGLRQDRCEGVYAREVAGETLLLVSYTEWFEDFVALSDGRLNLEWRAPGNEETLLRAYSLRPHLYYRMDALRSPGATSYSWPTDVLAALKVGKPDLGVVAMTNALAGGTKRQVYLPLRIGPPSSPGRAPNRQIILWSDTELSEVYLSVALVEPGGRSQPYLRQNKALGYGFYPAGRGITVALPEMKTKGIYRVEVGATLRQGGSSTASFWLYQSGE